VILGRIRDIWLSLKPVLQEDRSIELSNLLSRPVIIEVEGLGRDERTLLINLYLAQIFAYRIARGERGKLRHCIVFDEGKSHFDESRDATEEMGMDFDLEVL